MRVFKIVTALVVLALVVLVGWALWVGTRQDAAPPAPSFDRFRSPWESAMAKAGVEATFPAGPAKLTELIPSGRRAFEATFTAQEISALLNVYRHSEDVAGADVQVDAVGVTFSSPAQVELAGSILTGGSRYTAVAKGPARYAGRRITSTGLSALTVEGFAVGGQRRDQAGAALVEYFNAYLDAAPGLSVGSAEIVDGGVVVTGFAPASIQNPSSP
ncbi:MAG: hypothetical protein U1E26_08465 [Coriobacteriia bacterium]|nr:hypothetical protein [Coriobacteriia bacterium]